MSEHPTGIPAVGVQKSSAGCLVFVLARSDARSIRRASAGKTAVCIGRIVLRSAYDAG